jgi:hypothetical protein
MSGRSAKKGRSSMRISRALVPAAALAAALVTAGIASAQEAPPSTPSGTVSIKSVQVGFIGSANAGGGVLRYKGKSYKFSTGGAGVGGIGVSKMNASGAVYNLNSLSDFEGVYAQLRTGWAIGDQGRGRLWLRNPNGVVMRLNAKREGLSLSTGLDGMAVSLSR